MKKILISFICLVIFTSLISLESIELRSIPSFIGKHIFNPYDFSMKNIKEFATMPLKKKFSTITQHRFKSYFYLWLIVTNLHTITMIADTSIKLALLKRKKNLPHISYFFPIKRVIKKVFLELGVAHDIRGNIKRDKKQFLKFQYINSAVTVSGISWFYTPTLNFLYNQVYKEVYKRFKS